MKRGKIERLGDGRAMPAVHDAIHDSMGAPHKTVQTTQKRAFTIPRRVRPALAADTHVEVPDYLDPR